METGGESIGTPIINMNILKRSTNQKTKKVTSDLTPYDVDGGKDYVKYAYSCAFWEKAKGKVDLGEILEAVKLLEAHKTNPVWRLTKTFPFIAKFYIFKREYQAGKFIDFQITNLQTKKGKTK